MEFKLYPHPTDGICTPFVSFGKQGTYARYHFSGEAIELISISSYSNSPQVAVVGVDPAELLGNRVPNREVLLTHLMDCKSASADFRDYVNKTFVVPIFSLTREEAFIRTVLRQVISARLAKRLFSDFIDRFGYNEKGIYGFPSSEQLKRLSISDLRRIGLGFKAERIWWGLRVLRKDGCTRFTQMRGIGSWSKCILEVEFQKDYCFYPFWDKSGEKAWKICGIDLIKTASLDKELAADLHVYAASYLESKQ